MDMATTTHKEPAMTTTTKSVVYGTAAYGGKIHESSGGIAFCLSGNGHKPMRYIVAEVAYADGEYPTIAQRAAALTAAGVKPATMCRKCADHIADEMEAGA
jgi:hypothetical protein